MKGLELEQILGLIIIVVIIMIVVLIVFYPSLDFGKSSQTRINFEDFCLFWSLNGYSENIGEHVVRNNIDYGTPEEHCTPILKLIVPTQQDIDVCKKCCKKEIAC